MKWLKNRARFYLSCNYSCTPYLLVKIKEVKEPSHFSMLESKLKYNKTETKTAMVAKMVEFTLTSLIFVTFSVP